MALRLILAESPPIDSLTISAHELPRGGKEVSVIVSSEGRRSTHVIDPQGAVTTAPLQKVD